MRAVVQRVSRASVSVDGREVASIGRGVLALVGVRRGDDADRARALAAKIAGLRILADAEGKMNRSVLDEGAEALVVSQFTLYGDARRGRRPSFVDAAPPEEASVLVEEVVTALRDAGVSTRTGAFGASMAVDLVNDGPVTILIET